MMYHIKKLIDGSKPRISPLTLHISCGKYGKLIDGSSHEKPPNDKLNCCVISATAIAMVSDTYNVFYLPAMMI